MDLLFSRTFTTRMGFTPLSEGNALRVGVGEQLATDDCIHWDLTVAVGTKQKSSKELALGSTPRQCPSSLIQVVPRKLVLT